MIVLRRAHGYNQGHVGSLGLLPWQDLDRLQTIMSETHLSAAEHVLLCRIFEKHKCLKEILRHKVGGIFEDFFFLGLNLLINLLQQDCSYNTVFISLHLKNYKQFKNLVFLFYFFFLFLKQQYNWMHFTMNCNTSVVAP